MADKKISETPPRASLTAGDMIPIAAAGTTGAYHVTGETLFNSIPAASTAAAGVVELATAEEAMLGADTARAVTPAGLPGATSKIIKGVSNMDFIDAESYFLSHVGRAAVAGDGVIAYYSGAYALLLCVVPGVTWMRINEVSHGYP